MEIYKSVLGYEGIYEVSNLGNVRSLDRIVIYKDGRKRLWKGVLMTGGKTPTGYEFVSLKISGKVNQQYIHRLVAFHFIPNSENKKTVNHIDGNKSNNAMFNLEWNTPSENSIHAVKLGLSKCGENCTYSKLTNKKVLEIRENKHRLCYEYLSLIYGVSAGCIANIIKRKTWKHI